MDGNEYCIQFWSPNLYKDKNGPEENNQEIQSYVRSRPGGYFRDLPGGKYMNGFYQGEKKLVL